MSIASASYGKQCGLPSTVSGSTGGPTPEDRFVQRTTWTFGDFDVSYHLALPQRLDVDPTQAADTDPRVGLHRRDYNYIDLAGSWQITDWAKLKFARDQRDRRRSSVRADRDRLHAVQLGQHLSLDV